MTNKSEAAYLELLQELVTKAEATGFRDCRDGHKRCSLFGRQLRFDLQEGFPLLTHKKVFLRSIFEETVWFLSGSTNERDLAERMRGSRDREYTTIWTQNTLDGLTKDPNRFNGDNMGAMYNQAWRKLPCSPHGFQRVLKSTPAEDTYADVHVAPTLTKTRKTPKVVQTKNYGEFIVLGKVDDLHVCRFTNTGAYKLTKTISKNLKDDYSPTVCGVGYNTRSMNKSATHRALYRVWQDMLIRCYNPRSNHKNYKDLTVCKRWWNFENFAYDAYFLHGFQEYVDSGYTLQLDKDFLAGSQYSPENCIFIDKDLNRLLGLIDKFKVYEFNGGYYYSKKSLAIAKGISRRSVKLLDDVVVHEADALSVPRPIIWIDQITNMQRLIKNEPTSSRMVMNSWNPRQDNGVLAICHPMVQFFVEDGKLSCQLYQRSCDYIVGGCFNIASYALLTHMLAQQCDLEVGEFVWSLGDVHLYSDQLEMAKEILTRKTHPFPTIEIKKAVDLYSYEWSDITIHNYVHEAAIKIPVAK